MPTNDQHHPLAFENVTGDCFNFHTDSEMLQQGIEASRNSPRKRIILPIHREQEDLVQRMLNFLQPGTYVQPHWHPREFATETIYVMRGSIGFLELEENGDVRSSVKLNQGSLIDIVPKLWHSLIVLEPDTIILEVKRGPYNEEDKSFAPWSPAEGTEAATQLLEQYEKHFLN